MQLAEGAGKARVVDHAIAKARHPRMAQFQFIEHAGYALMFRVEPAIAPPGFVGLGTGVQFVRVDQDHAANGGKVLAASVPEALGTGLDDREHIAFMHMGCEPLLHIPGVQHFHIAQRRCLP